jgi:hypothetical protein
VFCTHRSQQHQHRIDGMKFATTAALLLATAAFSTAIAPAQAAPLHRGLSCVARVIHSEELPYAPIGFWLVRVTLAITPPDGSVYQATLQDFMPWQGAPPRRGQAFRLWCDPANPADLHLISRPGVPATF